MKTIKYEFADGTISEVEVDDELAESITVSRREEENYERKTRRYVKVSLDSCDYEGDWFADKAPTPYEAVSLSEEQARVDAFVESLTTTQKRRLQYRMEDPSISLREISRLEGVDIKTIRESFEGIQKKYKKFFNKK